MIASTVRRYEIRPIEGGAVVSLERADGGEEAVIAIGTFSKRVKVADLMELLAALQPGKDPYR